MRREDNRGAFSRSREVDGKSFRFTTLKVELPPNVIDKLRVISEEEGISIYALIRKACYVIVDERFGHGNVEEGD